MDIKKLNVLDVKVGDTLYRGSICEVLEISKPFMRGYGEDGHYYKAETISIKCQAIYDYDVAYAKEKGIDVLPRVYTFDYPTESLAMIVLSGEKVTITRDSGVWCDKFGRYLLPGTTVNMIE